MTATNVLFLLSDEHARSAAGCYGHPLVRTPTLDRLAARGQRFTRAYTPSPICIPARASLATGLPVFRHRCWSSAEPYHGQHESWMHRLRERGHHAVSIGKLHFRSGEDDNGFSEELLPMYLANNGRGWSQSLIRDTLPPFPEAVELARELGPGESDYTRYDRRITERACAWLREEGGAEDGPWALFVSFVSPHFPLTAPQAFFDLYAGLDVPPPRNGTVEHPVLREMRRFWDYDDYFEDDEARVLARRNYYGLCSFLDDNIRQVLAALDDSGQAERTTIVYTSDHGEMLGEQGFWTKSVMYEESVAVPMLLAGPGIPAGINPTPVSLNDLAATVEQAVAPGPRAVVEPWEARPLQDFAARPEPERLVISEYHDGGSPTGLTMLRQGSWKYVHYAGGHPAQLFDLDKDPGERNDLGTDPGYADLRATLLARLNGVLDPEAVNAQAFAEQKAKLEALGGAEKVLAMPSFNHTPLG